MRVSIGDRVVALLAAVPCVGFDVITTGSQLSVLLFGAAVVLVLVATTGEAAIGDRSGRTRLSALSKVVWAPKAAFSTLSDVPRREAVHGVHAGVSVHRPTGGATSGDPLPSVLKCLGSPERGDLCSPSAPRWLGSREPSDLRSPGIPRWKGSPEPAVRCGGASKAAYGR